MSTHAVGPPCIDQPGAPFGEKERVIADSGRRPLSDAEHTHAIALGEQLRALRLRSGRSQVEIATAAGMATRSLRRLERGERRTRASTLERLVHAMALEDADKVLHDLLATAAPVLAEESRYRDRVERRRDRRRRAASRRFITECVVTRTPTPDGVQETTTMRRRVSRHRVTESATTRMLPPAS